MRVNIVPLLLLAACSPSPLIAETHWPIWRGSQQNGVASGTGYPIQWSEANGVRWKTEIPGAGGSTPIVIDSKIFITSGVAGNSGGTNTLFAVDAATGKVSWQTGLGADRGGKHRKGGGSNPSAITDGDHVYAYFRSGDLACVSVKDGSIKWQVNLQEKFGEDTLWWDLGTSPILTDDAVVVAVMQTGPSYLVAFNRITGDMMWKTDRMVGAPEEAAQSYSTPLIVKVNEQPAIAVMGADHLTIHSANDGKQLAILGGFNPKQEKYFRSIASPVAEGDLIVCPYSRGGTITAVRMSDLVAGKGDAAIAWFRDDVGSDVPTPVAKDGRLYVAGDKGTIHCLDIASGKTIWQVELAKSKSAITSSPLLASNHLYSTREDATTYVIGPLDAKQPTVVATNKLADDEPFTVASLVPADSDLLLRSKHTLYRLGR
jgi:outer membrane protein assembly factor BamB